MPALVVPTMVSVAVDVPVAPGAPALPDPVIVTTVAVPAPALAPVASDGRAALASAVAPMAVASFSVAVAPVAPVQPASAPATPVATPVELSVAPASPAAPAVPTVGPSLSDAMVVGVGSIRHDQCRRWD